MISCEGYDVQALFKHPIRLILNSCFLFSQWPWDGQNLPKLGVSVGCLEGVWKVSGRCLGVVWMPLDTVWGVIMPFHVFIS